MERREAPAHAELRRDVWQLVHFSLSRYLRYHTSRVGQLAHEDLEDIASEKSLELIQNIDTSSGSFGRLKATEIPGFLSTVARNGLIDGLKARRRLVQTEEGDDMTDQVTTQIRIAPDRPDTPVERAEFAQALRKCAEALDGRTRMVWFFRVFYDMSSKRIAKHPKVELKASHVDVMLQRGRESVTQCMKKKGYEPQDMPPGTFVALWKMFHPEIEVESEEVV